MKKAVWICLLASVLLLAGCSNGQKALETTGDAGLDALVAQIFTQIGAQKQASLQSADIDEQTGEAVVALDYRDKAVTFTAKRFDEDWLPQKLYAGELTYWEPQYPISPVYNIDTDQPWQSESYYKKIAGLSDGNRLKINIGLDAQDQLCNIVVCTFTGENYQNELAEIITAYDVGAAQGAGKCTAIVSTKDRDGQPVSGRIIFAGGKQNAYHLPYSDGDRDFDVDQNALAAELLYLLQNEPRR